MRKIVTLALVVITQLLEAQNFNMQLVGTLPYSNSCANIGGYVDVLGNEYALVGVSDKLSIVDVTVPSNPIEKFSVPMVDNLWKEVKTWGNYAYVTTEACCDQVTIVNLQYLPDSVQSKTYNGDGAIAGQLQSVHALHIDDGYLYLHGSNLFGGATLICSLADPWNPQYISYAPTSYVHDAYVRNDTLWTANIYDGMFSAVDVSNKANPVVLNTQTTPDHFTHNCWLNDAGNVLFTTDETSNSFVAAYEVSDVNNIKFLDKIQTAPGSNAIVHNTHVLNDYLITSWYTEGLNIIDASRPHNLIEVAKYDTYTGSGTGFTGVWGVYPYLPSGNIVVASMDGHLYVVAPTYTRGCYLEGTIIDSISGMGISNAKVEILGQYQTEYSQANGNYATGIANMGTYTVKVSKSGYFSKTITNVALSNGNLTLLDVQLIPKSVMSLTGTIINISNGLPIDSAIVHASDGEYEFTTNTDANGYYAFNNLYEGNYEISASKWLMSDSCVSSYLIGPNTIDMGLTPRLWDSFINDNGWTVLGGNVSGQWVRAVPRGTYFNNMLANTDTDNPNDCGKLCYVTGNTDEMDFVKSGAIMSTPILDLTSYIDPHIRFKYYLSFLPDSNGNPGVENFIVRLSNGSTALNVFTITTATTAVWHDTTLRVADYMTPTANVRVRFTLANVGTINVVEGAIDDFEVYDMPLSMTEVAGTIHAYITYSQGHAVLNIKHPTSPVTVAVYDAKGSLHQYYDDASTSLSLQSNLKPGIYMVEIKDNKNASSRLKFVVY